MSETSATMFLSDDEVAPRRRSVNQSTIGPGRIKGIQIVLENNDQLPSWSRDLIRDSIQLIALPEGWDSYGARSINQDAIEIGLSALFQVAELNWMAPTIVPTSAGGILLGWHNDDMDLEIEVSPTGQMKAFFDNGQVSDEWKINFTSDLDKFKEIASSIITFPK